MSRIKNWGVLVSKLDPVSIEVRNKQRFYKAFPRTNGPLTRGDKKSFLEGFLIAPVTDAVNDIHMRILGKR